MKEVASIAALIGDPTRANMLLALMQGGARTLSELAQVAAVGLPTASAHAAQLQAGGLIVARKSGRHKYLALASAEVAAVVEQLMALQQSLQPQPEKPHRLPGPKDPAQREARVCYDHLAGARGVQLFQSLGGSGGFAHQGARLVLTEAGQGIVLQLGLGLTLADLHPGKPELCRDCLDWSQRQSHRAGRLGRLLLARMESAGWISRDRSGASRRLVLSPQGVRAFDRCFPTDRSPAGWSPADRHLAG